MAFILEENAGDTTLIARSCEYILKDLLHETAILYGGVCDIAIGPSTNIPKVL